MITSINKKKLYKFEFTNEQGTTKEAISNDKELNENSTIISISSKENLYYANYTFNFIGEYTIEDTNRNRVFVYDGKLVYRIYDNIYVDIDDNIYVIKNDYSYSGAHISYYEFKNYDTIFNKPIDYWYSNLTHSDGTPEYAIVKFLDNDTYFGTTNFNTSKYNSLEEYLSTLNYKRTTYKEVNQIKYKDFGLILYTDDNETIKYAYVNYQDTLRDEPINFYDMETKEIVGQLVRTYGGDSTKGWKYESSETSEIKVLYESNNNSATDQIIDWVDKRYLENMVVKYGNSSNYYFVNDLYVGNTIHINEYSHDWVIKSKIFSNKDISYIELICEYVDNSGREELRLSLGRAKVLYNFE